ncbi:hypothetical protein HUE56_12085 [Azospirillum oryzae]|uniref:Uncharacterized protein n=1 Tax=Azospirillum oryzae TaxID=286727 RepID=A0A6N1AHJ4_9PROT|nr:hypothetical protein [Azospirillum oryzae]KAA0589392.1 hypothetical protein FZ938_07090 [Azospirillum oryzae]QKS51235.1 hypothetical protein HUE56_12085 [Azospirillum oryzae]GLR79475.1 hypothetical protein GCM10007856_21500 [Azospirillum oryzae]
MVDRYELMSPEDYESLPLDAEEAFAEADRICLNKMALLIDQNSSQDFDELIRTNYVSTMIGLANVCGLSSILAAEPDHYGYDTFQRFSIAVKKETARIRFKNRGRAKEKSVLLTDNAKVKIKHYIDRLRSSIKDSDFSDEKKKSLLISLSDFEEELNKPRFSYAVGFVILVTLTQAAGAMTTIFADGGTAITNILKIIGKDIETETHATLRLSPPTKALPPPIRQNNQTPARGVAEENPIRDNIDEEIPF